MTFKTKPQCLHDASHITNIFEVFLLNPVCTDKLSLLHLNVRQTTTTAVTVHIYNIHTADGHNHISLIKRITTFSDTLLLAIVF